MRGELAGSWIRLEAWESECERHISLDQNLRFEIW
eukprot:COSAG01_NODE_16399_length_1239_cov_2.971930_3_plen_34_part_01